MNGYTPSFWRMSTVSGFFVPAQSVAVRALAPAAGLLAVNGADVASRARIARLSARPSRDCWFSGLAQRLLPLR